MTAVNLLRGNDMKPTIGRIVHYYDNMNKRGPHAAIVVQVTTGELLPEQRIDLQVFWRDGGTSNRHDIPFIEWDIPVPPERELPYAIWPPRV